MRRQGGFWKNVLAGLLMGIGCVLPGVSGGVMAVSFGLYRPMLDAVLGIFHDTRRKLVFLAPLALGGAAGLLLGARGLGAAMRLYEKPMLCLFTGFILGGVPALDIGAGICVFGACLPMAIGGYVTAVAQGRCAAAGIGIVAKRPDQGSKGILMALMVEFYAILCLLASFLMIFFFAA